LFAGKIKWAAVGLVIIGIAVGFFPIRYLAAPKWDVVVLNEAGESLSGLNVRLVYENYSAESDSHEITLVTDQSGRVAFPSQYRTASLLQRAFYIARSALEGIHASFGNHAFVFVFGSGYDGDAVDGPYITDWTGSPAEMRSKIIAKHSEGSH